MKIDRSNFTPRELLYYHYSFELGLPRIVVCDLMGIGKSMYYKIKLSVEEKVERQRRRWIIANQ